MRRNSEALDQRVSVRVRLLAILSAIACSGLLSAGAAALSARVAQSPSLRVRADLQVPEGSYLDLGAGPDWAGTSSYVQAPLAWQRPELPVELVQQHEASSTRYEDLGARYARGATPER